MLCCRCNSSSRCLNCSCVKSGLFCLNCLPLCWNNCPNDINRTNGHHEAQTFDQNDSMLASQFDQRNLNRPSAATPPHELSPALLPTLTSGCASSPTQEGQPVNRRRNHSLQMPSSTDSSEPQNAERMKGMPTCDNHSPLMVPQLDNQPPVEELQVQPLVGQSDEGSIPSDDTGYLCTLSRNRMSTLPPFSTTCSTPFRWGEVTGHMFCEDIIHAYE